MIVPDVGQNTDLVLTMDNIRSVKQTTQSDLDDRVVDFLPGKFPVGERNKQLKVRWM